MFQLHLFSNKAYTTGLGITLSYCIGYFSLTTLLTLYLQGAQQISPLESGLLLIPLSAPQLVMGPIGGKLADRFGSMRTMVVGLLFVTVSFLLLGNLGEQLSTFAVMLPLFIISVANGLAWPALVKSVLSASPKEHAGSASGMFYTIYNVGRVMSQTLALVIVELCVAPQYASQMFLGLGVDKSVIKNAVVHMTDIGFRMFAIFILLAFVLVFFMRQSKPTQK